MNLFKIIKLAKIGTFTGALVVLATNPEAIKLANKVLSLLPI